MLPSLVATEVQRAHLVLRGEVLACLLKCVSPAPVLLSGNLGSGQPPHAGPGLNQSTSTFQPLWFVLRVLRKHPGLWILSTCGNGELCRGPLVSRLPTLFLSVVPSGEGCLLRFIWEGQSSALMFMSYLTSAWMFLENPPGQAFKGGAKTCLPQVHLCPHLLGLLFPTISPAEKRCFDLFDIFSYLTFVLWSLGA